MDLTNGQFSLLMSLNRSKPPGMGDVASLLGDVSSLLTMDRTTLTAALKPLERRCLIKVSADPDDGRGRLLALTPKGKRLLANTVPIWEKTHKEIEGLLPDGDPTRLRGDLRVLSGGGQSPD